MLPVKDRTVVSLQNSTQSGQILSYIFILRTVIGYVYLDRGRCERRHTMLFLFWITLLLLVAIGTLISTQLYTRYNTDFMEPEE
jgi:uncharacterized membrane protein